MSDQPIHVGECGPYKVRLFEDSIEFRLSGPSVLETTFGLEEVEEVWETRKVPNYGLRFGDFVRTALSDDMLRLGFQATEDFDALCIYDHGDESEESARTGEGRAGQNFGYVVNVQWGDDYDEWTYHSQWPRKGETIEDQQAAMAATMEAFGVTFVIDVGPQAIYSDPGEK